MEFVNEIGEVEVSNSHRFLIPPNGMPCKSLVEREFNLRFDFTLAVSLKLAGSVAHDGTYVEQCSAYAEC